MAEYRVKIIGVLYFLSLYGTIVKQRNKIELVIMKIAIPFISREDFFFFFLPEARITIFSNKLNSSGQRIKMSVIIWICQSSSSKVPETERVKN